MNGTRGQLAKCIEEFGEATKRLTSDVTSKYRDVEWLGSVGCGTIESDIYTSSPSIIEVQVSTN